MIFDEIVENQHEDTQQKCDYDIDIGQSAKNILKVSFQIVYPESSSLIESVDNSGDESLAEKSEVVTLGKRKRKITHELLPRMQLRKV